MTGHNGRSFKTFFYESKYLHVLQGVLQQKRTSIVVHVCHYTHPEGTRCDREGYHLFTAPFFASYLFSFSLAYTRGATYMYCISEVNFFRNDHITYLNGCCHIHGVPRKFHWVGLGVGGGPDNVTILLA